VGLSLVVLRPVDPRLVDPRLVDPRLVGPRLVGQMVLLAVLHKCIFWVQASLPPVVISIQMERELFCQYLLYLADLGDPGLWLGIVPRRHHLRDP
jgi:hypothetical protein